MISLTEGGVTRKVRARSAETDNSAERVHASSDLSLNLAVTAACPTRIALRELRLASGEIRRLNPEKSQRRINIFWVYVVDDCRYDCENGFMTVTEHRVCGVTV